MPKIQYKTVAFRAPTKTRIEQANEIIEEYAAQGFDLTLRQLYYQFVARDLIANDQAEYKKLGSIVNDARLAGLIDWDSIADRTRFLRAQSHWDSPTDIVESCAAQFRVDRWRNQPTRIEVWIEKDALVGVIEGVCQELDVPFFSCRGYVSQSEMWRAARRHREYLETGQEVLLLHLGDHDPSGIDMTRDIQDRLWMFDAGVTVRRIALNMEQVEEYQPPPNPAKLTDSRARDYVVKFGSQSWELDALDPTTLAGLIRDNIEDEYDGYLWEATLAEEKDHRRLLEQAAVRWDDVVKYLEGEEA